MKVTDRLWWGQEVVLAIFIPLAAAGLQWVFWSYLSPFVWFLFFPAIFLSARFTSFRGGLFSTFFSALLVYYIFIPPQFSWEIAHPENLFSVVLFLIMGYLFSDTQHRLRLANQKTSAALVETKAAKEQVSQLYQKTLELDEIKSQFFANVSHELRTPLMLIMGPVEKLLTATNLAPEVRYPLEVIERNARFLYRHVTDLLDVAKIEAKRMKVDYAATDLAQLTRLVASQFEVLAADGPYHFKLILPATLPAQLDVEKTQRVLLNLLSNAFKFTPLGGTIALTLTTRQNFAVWQIADSGTGIPLELREKIFERFRQVEGHAARQHGGTGLGLAIVKEFVELHGGTVTVSDAAEGGALFTVELPLFAPAGVAVTPATDSFDRQLRQQIVEELAQEKPSGEHWLQTATATAPLILVVEDNADMNDFVAGTLAVHYRLLTARDGQAGLEKARAFLPDLIVTDVMMPKLSGDRLVAALQAEPTTKHIPVLVLTAKSDEALRLQLLQHGVKDYLAKPFQVEELLARVNTILAEQRRARDALQVEQGRAQKYLQMMPALVLALDSAGVITFINDYGSRLLEAESAEHLLGRNWFETFLPLPAQAAATEKFLRQLRHPVRVSEYTEFSIVTLKGQEKTIRWYSTVTTDDLGQVTGLLSASEDVTELKRTLAISHARARLVEFALTHSMDAVLQKTLDELELLTQSTIGFYHFLEEDQQTLALQNWSANTLAHMCKAEGKGAHYAVNQAGVWADCIRLRQPVFYNDYPALAHRKGLPEGHAAITRLVSVPIFRGNKICAILGVGNRPTPYTPVEVEIISLLGDLSWDVVERRQMEEALHLAESNFRNIFENSTVGIFQSSPAGRFLQVNPAMATLFGYQSPIEMVESLTDLAHQLYASPTGREEFIRLFVGREVVRDFEAEMVRKDGTHMMIAMNVRAVRDGAGGLRYYEGFMQDVTERRRAEEQLRVALAEKEVLLRELHHRTKNNLNIVSSLIELQADASTNDDFRILAAALENRLRSISLVHQMLYQARDLSRIDLSEYTQSLVNNLLGSLAVSPEQVQVALDLSEVLVEINVAIPCGQILNELISNALKYAFPEGRNGTLTISLRQAADGEVTLVVADDGVGFPANYNEATSTSLGMMLVRTLVKQLHGQLALHTQGGTRYEIKFKETA